MKLLPTDQQKEIGKRLLPLLQQAERGQTIELREPCDCGAHIRHNNGGNYHEIISIVKDDGRWFIKYDDTCGMTPESEWQESNLQNIETAIKKALKNGYD